MKYPIKRVTLVFLATSLLLIGGCSMFRLAYNNADIAINWMLDDYFDLHGEQHALLKTKLETLQTWHRSEELPLYVEGLKATQARLRQTVQREDIDWFMDMVKKRYERLVREAAPDAADLLATLTPEQIRNLEKKYAKNNRKFSKEHKLTGTPSEQREARAKKTIDMIEDWVGNLSGEQEAQLRQSIEAWPMNYSFVEEDRQRHQREFVVLLGKNHDASTLAPLLADWMIHYEDGRSPEYAAYSQQRTENFINLVLQTDRMLKPKQRTHLIHKLQTYINDFSSLSRPRQLALPTGNALAAETAK
ncbi:MAG: DUF6279 family lipoprotein [Burkholderiales bacterium]